MRLVFLSAHMVMVCSPSVGGKDHACCRSCTCQEVMLGDAHPCMEPPEQVVQEERECKGKCEQCQGGNGEYSHGGNPPPPPSPSAPCNSRQKRLVTESISGTRRHQPTSSVVHRPCDVDLDVVERFLQRCTIDGVAQVFGESFCAPGDSHNDPHEQHHGNRDHPCGAAEMKVTNDPQSCEQNPADVNRWLQIDGRECTIGGVQQKVGVTFCVVAQGGASGGSSQTTVQASNAKGVIEAKSTVGGIQGFTTYRLSVQLASSAASIYTIYGDDSRSVRGGSSMIFPPAYQVQTPFGANTGGVNPQFFAMKKEAEFDSWLTVGLTQGGTSSTLGSVGIDWSTWSESHGIHTGKVGGAVFWMDPIEGPSMSDSNGKAGHGGAKVHFSG
jgi:hypothetical protein